MEGDDWRGKPNSRPSGEDVGKKETRRKEVFQGVSRASQQRRRVGGIVF